MGTTGLMIRNLSWIGLLAGYGLAAKPSGRLAGRLRLERKR